MDISKLQKLASIEIGRRVIQGAPPAPTSDIDSVLMAKVASADQGLLSVAIELCPEDPFGYYEKLGGRYDAFEKEAARPRSPLVGASRPTATIDPATGQVILGAENTGYIPKVPPPSSPTSAGVVKGRADKILEMQQDARDAQAYAARQHIPAASAIPQQAVRDAQAYAARQAPASVIPDLLVPSGVSAVGIKNPHLDQIPGAGYPTIDRAAGRLTHHPNPADVSLAMTVGHTGGTPKGFYDKVINETEKSLLGNLAEKGRSAYNKVHGAVTSETSKKILKGIGAAAAGGAALAGGAAAVKAVKPPPPPTLMQSLGKHAPLLGLGAAGLGGGLLLSNYLSGDNNHNVRTASIKEALPRWQKELEAGNIGYGDAAQITGVAEDVIRSNMDKSQRGKAFLSKMRDAASASTAPGIQKQIYKVERNAIRPLREGLSSIPGPPSGSEHGKVVNALQAYRDERAIREANQIADKFPVERSLAVGGPASADPKFVEATPTLKSRGKKLKGGRGLDPRRASSGSRWTDELRKGNISPESLVPALNPGGANAAAHMQAAALDAPSGGLGNQALAAQLAQLEQGPYTRAARKGLKEPSFFADDVSKLTGETVAERLRQIKADPEMAEGFGKARRILRYQRSGIGGKALMHAEDIGGKALRHAEDLAGSRAVRAGAAGLAGLGGLGLLGAKVLSKGKVAPTTAQVQKVLESTGGNSNALKLLGLGGAGLVGGYGLQRALED